MKLSQDGCRVASCAEHNDILIVAEYSPADTSFRWNITYVGIDTPLIKQTHSAGCGATATLMYTYGMGLDEIDSTVNPVGISISTG